MLVISQTNKKQEETKRFINKGLATRKIIQCFIRNVYRRNIDRFSMIRNDAAAAFLTQKIESITAK